MKSSSLLPNAPLVEVIAEVHWKMNDQESLPQPNLGSYDPDWFELEREVRGPLQEVLPVLDPVVDAGKTVSLDMLGRSPIVRYRAKPGSWPLIQLGQGLFTVNATPPYDGWARIADILTRALDGALSASPILRSKQLVGSRLLYRDAFTARHGVESPLAFLRDELRLFPREAVSKMSALVKEGAPFLSTGEVSFPLRDLANSAATVKHGLGKVNLGNGNEDAAVVEFAVAAVHAQPISTRAVLDWFTAAHDICHVMFKDIIPPATMERLRHG